MSDFAIPRPRAAILTLGCKVNQYESEAIAEGLSRAGIEMAAPDTVCDVYVVNTCTVTAESDRKSRQAIRRLLSQNPNAFMLVTGCSAQLRAQTIAAISGVDYVGGNRNKMAVVDTAVRLLQAGCKTTAPIVDVSPLEDSPFEAMSITRFDRTRAYVKIQDGCQSHCTYCTIPKARGSIRSKPPKDALCEVQRLTESGCGEIVLTGIETGSYGYDLGEYRLPDLLSDMDNIPHIGRIRLGSLDPSIITPTFARRMGEISCLAPHFHLSMQSGSRSVLARMKRKYNPDQALAAMERLRAVLPHVSFTTDMIVGFPGETEAEFEETLAFVRKAGFLQIHVFPYSRREGTPAADMPDQIPEPIKKERVSRLTEEANRIRYQLLSDMIAQCPIQTVLFEQTAGRDNAYTGHTPTFAEVKVVSNTDLCGVECQVRLTDVEKSREGYRLVAEVVIADSQRRKPVTS